MVFEHASTVHRWHYRSCEQPFELANLDWKKLQLQQLSEELASPDIQRVHLRTPPLKQQGTMVSSCLKGSLNFPMLGRRHFCTVAIVLLVTRCV